MNSMEQTTILHKSQDWGKIDGRNRASGR